MARDEAGRERRAGDVQGRRGVDQPGRQGRARHLILHVNMVASRDQVARRVSSGNETVLPGSEARDPQARRQVTRNGGYAAPAMCLIVAGDSACPVRALSSAAWPIASSVAWSAGPGSGTAPSSTRTRLSARARAEWGIMGSS